MRRRARGALRRKSRRRKAALPQSNLPAAVNSGRRYAASNRAERQREAEQDGVLVEQSPTRRQAGVPEAGGTSPAARLRHRHWARARRERRARDRPGGVPARLSQPRQFQGGSSFFTWLYRIVTNLAIDLMRKPARREAELFDNPPMRKRASLPLRRRISTGPIPFTWWSAAKSPAASPQALDALPPYHRAVILMREVEGMSYEEMAEAMGVSKGTIMSRLFHARQKLQRALVDCFREQLGRDPSPESANDEWPPAGRSGPGGRTGSRCRTRGTCG